MMPFSMKTYLALLWGISVLYAMESDSINTSTTETSSINSITEPHKPAEISVALPAETTVETKEANTTAGAAVNTTAGAAHPSHKTMILETANPREDQIHHQSPTTSTDMTAPVAAVAVSSQQPSSTTKSEATSTEVSTTEVSTTEVSTTEVSTTDVSTTDVSTTDVSITNVSITNVSTTEVSTTEVSTTDVSTTNVSSTDVSITNVSITNVSTTEVPTTDVSITDVSTTDVSTTDVSTTDVSTTDVSTTEVSTTEVSTTDVSTTNVSTTNVSTTEVSTTNVSTTNVSTTEVSTSPKGILIHCEPKTLPVPTTKSTPVTTTAPRDVSKCPPNTEVQPCSNRHGEKRCLIAIASLAALATGFMVSTIILCTKLSKRKYKVKKSQPATEMMCISALLPERNITYSRQRNPVTNGVLVIHDDADSDEDGGDNLTLTSFLPENDRFV